MTQALMILLCAALLCAGVVELVRYERKLRKRIQFDRLRARVVDNR